MEELSRSRSLLVTARNSSFAYRGQPVNVKRVARELGVRYVVEGSVRRDAERVRINTQLLEAETAFFEARKLKDLAYFRSHIPENGVFWGENGTFSRGQQLQEQADSAKACTIEGYSLSDFGMLPLASGAYLLTYKAEQYATCSGEKAPVHINGSSVYIFKDGRWQAVYRAEVPLKNQN